MSETDRTDYLVSRLVDFPGGAESIQTKMADIGSCHGRAKRFTIHVRCGVGGSGGQYEELVVDVMLVLWIGDNKSWAMKAVVWD